MNVKRTRTPELAERDCKYNRSIAIDGELELKREHDHDLEHD